MTVLIVTKPAACDQASAAHRSPQPEIRKVSNPKERLVRGSVHGYGSSNKRTGLAS